MQRPWNTPIWSIHAKKNPQTHLSLCQLNAPVTNAYYFNSQITSVFPATYHYFLLSDALEHSSHAAAPCSWAQPRIIPILRDILVQSTEDSDLIFLSMSARAKWRGGKKKTPQRFQPGTKEISARMLGHRAVVTETWLMTEASIY